MQYITQCSSTRDVITTSLSTNNYLLSQIVKEQPRPLRAGGFYTAALLEEALRSLAFAALLLIDSSFPLFAGGANRDRTGDLLLAKQALSQLSYGPWAFTRLVGLDGFEPSTPALSRRCSNQLSYRPVRPSQLHTTDRWWALNKRHSLERR
jgi:hypothetical protein